MFQKYSNKYKKLLYIVHVEYGRVFPYILFFVGSSVKHAVLYVATFVNLIL